jgi:hypothetical protein
LSYEDARDVTEELSAPMLDALSSKMLAAKDGSGINYFSQTSVNQVRAAAALIPAVVKPAEVDKVKRDLTTFYITPNSSNFNPLISTYRNLSNDKAYDAANALYNVLKSLNPELLKKM